LAIKNKHKEQNKAGRKYIALIIPLLIMIVTLIVFNPSMDNGILHGWDDTEYLNDRSVQEFRSGIFFSDYYLGMYQPLAVFTLAMNYRSAVDSATAYHASNLFLHLINILLLWLLLIKLTGRKSIAGIGALLFAIHPLNVEPIAWISARSTLLFTAFYIGGLLSYLKYTENKKPLYFTITLLLALAALFSKSMAISFPLVLFVMDYFKGRTWHAKLILEKLPFLIFSVIFGFVTIDAAQSFGHITALQYEYSLLNRFFILCHTFDFYLFKFIVPTALSPIYAYPELNGGTLPWLYYLSPAIPLLLIYLVYRFRNTQKELISGILIFTLVILPVLPLFWSRIFVAADRYAYLSYTGLFLIAGYLLYRLFSGNLLKNKSLRYAGIIILAAYAAFLMYTSNQQCKYWKDGETLLSHSIYLAESKPALALSYFYRGNIIQNIAETKYLEGQNSKNEGKVKNSFIYYRNAIQDYDSAIAFNPSYMLAYSNRGMIYGTMAYANPDYWKKANNDFDEAIRIQPDYADNYYNKAWLAFIGGDTIAACELWKKADDLGSVVAEKALEENCW
jgi:hypothetical protein